METNFTTLCLLGQQASDPEEAARIDAALRETDEFKSAMEVNAMLANGCITAAEWQQCMSRIISF